MKAILASRLPHYVCILVAFFSWVEKDALFANALSASTATATAAATAGQGVIATATSAPSPRISRDDVERIANGGVAVLRDFVPEDLVRRMRLDALQLKKKGAFRPDGLTNNALGDSTKQGFTRSSDRQTFRGVGSGSPFGWFTPDLEDYATRMEFDGLMASLRKQLAADLQRPSLLVADPRADQMRHEITYNWYEPGAKLGIHLDEHHEETKGPKGWQYPTRRSVTWLLYLNDNWTADEGGALLCHPRSGHDGTDDVTNTIAGGPIGSHEGNLQVGWIDDHTPVYLDAFRDSGRTALYSCKPPNQKSNSKTLSASAPPSEISPTYERVYWSKRDFDVPAEPIDFRLFLPKGVQQRFEQISTARNDPRFAIAKGNTNANANSSSMAKSTAISTTKKMNDMEVTPAGGTLVVFDSVTLPHSVLEVTGNRQRIAATGWFHEDSQFTFGA